MYKLIGIITIILGILLKKYMESTPLITVLIFLLVMGGTISLTFWLIDRL